MSSDRERIEALLKRAEEISGESKRTDYKMPIILPFIPAILEVIAMILMLFGFFYYFLRPGHIYYAASIYQDIPPNGVVIYPFREIGYGILLIALLMYFYIVYKWIKRRNDHFARTLSFYENIAEAADILKFKRAYSIKSRFNELKEVNSKTKSAIANAILIIVPFYIFYVFHFLNKDFYKHSEKEKLLLSELFDEIKEKIPSFTRKAEEFAIVPDRSTFLYIILYLISSGLFGIYWVYTLTNDPNKHFESHELIEKELITALREISSKQ
ncbi:MAG: hypothetical protein C0179_00545 [Fervidicoccus sp.]|nr:MAG: hypothetical protein C0179_00545 [Fervidicoccus sp.]